LLTSLSHGERGWDIFLSSYQKNRSLSLWERAIKRNWGIVKNLGEGCVTNRKTRRPLLI
jgi:hypothetical protein